MNIKHFREFLVNAIDRVEEVRNFGPLDAVDDCLEILEDARREAASLGLWEIVQADVEIRTAGDLRQVTAILSRCLAECDSRLDAESDAGKTEQGKPIGSGPYTVAEVAKRLGVSERHVYDLVKEGKISSQKHGDAIRITRDQLDRYERDAERQRVKPTGYRHLP